MQGILRNYDPIRQFYIFCPLTRTFDFDESYPLIVPHEYIQPVEIAILEYIHNSKYNHKLYNLIQNTPHENSPSSERHKIIKANYCKLNISPACLSNFYYHRTSFTIFSQKDFLLTIK